MFVTANATAGDLTSLPCECRSAVLVSCTEAAPAVTMGLGAGPDPLELVSMQPSAADSTDEVVASALVASEMRGSTAAAEEAAGAMW